MTIPTIALAQLLDQSPEVVLVTNAEGTVVYANRRVEDVFGVAAGELVGGSVDGLLPERLRPERRALRRALLQGERPEWADVEHAQFGLHRDGHEFPVDVRVAPATFGSDRLLISTIRDATDHQVGADSLPAVLEASINEIYVFDAQSLRFINANLAARRNLGYSMTQLRGLTPIDIKPLFSRAEFEAMAMRLRNAEGRSEVFQTEHQRQDGSRYPVDVHLQYTRLAEQPVFLAIVLDVTQREQAERALRQSEARFREMTQSLPFIVWAHDATGAQEFVNQTFCDFFGVKAEDMGTDKWRILIHPEDEAAYVGEFMRCVRERQPFHASCRVRVPSGQWRRVESMGRIRWSDNGEFRGLIGSSVDVTAREATEAALKASEARFRALVEATAAIVWTTDAAGEFSTPQTGWIAYTGQTEAHARGTGGMQAIHPEDRERIVQRWGKALAGTSAYHTEARVWHAASQGWRRCEFRGVPLLDAAGTVQEWVGMCVDIEDKARLQDEWEQLTGQLLEADRRKDEFLATLAHELRNPLAPISNGIEILRRESRNRDAIGRTTEMLARQVAQMVRLVDDLLDLSRISRGIVELRRARFDLVACVREATQAARSLFGDERRELTVTLPTDPVLVDGDAMRIAQVIHNLLGNAVKFTEAGGHLTVALSQTGNHAELRVRDDGVGIAAEDIGKLFVMFSQLPDPRHRQHGLGIGLALSKMLIERHGGAIEVRSEGHGRGSEFIVRLPMAAPLPAGGTGEETRSSDPSPAAARASGADRQKILIVDDNEDAAMSLAMLLESSGFDVAMAFDGPQALNQLTTFKPALAVLDLGLPGMDGYEVARAIRARPDAAGIKLIALTGWGQPQDKERSAQAGFDAHLVKPVDVGNLLSTFRALGDSTA